MVKGGGNFNDTLIILYFIPPNPAQRLPLATNGVGNKRANTEKVNGPYLRKYVVYRG